MRPVKLKDLPRERQAEVRRLAGVPSRGYRPKAARVSNSIPASWTDHRKTCGWAGMGDWCPYCGDEGEQNMWKRLDESIALSDKLAELSWVSLGIWTYLLAQTDTMGRFPRDSRVIKARCMPMRYDLRPETVEEALLEIEKSGLLHCYAAEGKTYLVLHDYREYNPPGALGRVSPKYPAPGPGVCSCTDSERRESGVRTPDVTSRHVTSTSEGVQGEPFSPTSPEAQIMGLLERAHCPSKPDTQRRYAKAWITQKGFQYVEQACSDPFCRGKDVIAINDRFFREPKNGKHQGVLKRKIHDPNCLNCAGKGRRLNPVTNAEMDCCCVREVAV